MPHDSRLDIPVQRNLGAGRKPVVLSVAGLAAWIALYASLESIAEAAFRLVPLDRGTQAANAIRFFIFEAPKVLLLLVLVVFAMGIVHTFFTAERTRELLAGRREGVGNVLAASLGVVTPFCSCSAVPLFIGLLTAGVPLGVTFSFLIAAPMVNEVALALLFGLFGWKIALLYLALGLSVAIGAGLVIGRLRMESWVEDWVRNLPAAGAGFEHERLTWSDRCIAGWRSVKEIVGRVWPYILAGIAVGGAIHGYVPENFMAAIMGGQAWWSVPLAVVIGVPMYSNAAGMIPVVEALLAKGAALGTVLAFMMAVIALSLPEMIILRKVLKVRLIGVFAGVVAVGILLVGYVFNAVF
ncbi:MAG: permease [Betaproteobacteria bacterium]